MYGGGLYDNQTALRVTIPGGAAYSTGSSTISGAIKVRIPTALLGSNTMMGFDVNVYTYDGQSFTIRCGGYNYSDAGKTWYNEFAYMLTGNRAALNVRFGWDGTSQCIWIGELASSWSYPQVHVSNFTGGYSGLSTSWASGWSVSFETSSFYSVSRTQTVYPFPYYSSQSAILYSTSSMRTPIFYDSDDTGYYCNPNGTSNLNVVGVQRAYAGYDAGVTNSFSCSDWFRSSGSTGWYNASYTGGIYMEDSTWVRVYNSKAFYVGNAIAATGNITAYYSDERLKTKISGIENAIEKVRKLNGFYYIENDLAKSFGYNNKNKQVALSAQSVQSVLPEAVSLAPFDIQTDEFTGEITSKTGENYLTVDYSRLVPLLVEAIKEQDKEVVDLHAKVARLESLISKLIDV